MSFILTEGRLRYTMTDTTTVKTRQPSPFKNVAKINVMVHSDAKNGISNDSLTAAIAAQYKGLTTRVTHRTRAGGAKTGIPSYSVYVGPEGFEFPKSGPRGVRLSADVAALLRGVAQTMGLDPSDPAAIETVAKALAQKATVGK